MKIAVAQINPTVGDLEGNARKIISCIARARKSSCDLVVFPELAVTGYPPRDLLLYNAFIAGIKRTVMESILPETGNISVLLGAPWIDGGRLFNSALLLSHCRVVSRHDKTLLPNYDVFDESRYFTPSRQRGPASLGGRSIAVTVCEDIWNDKDFWERRIYLADPVEELFQKGADLLINLSASPFSPGKVSQRNKILSSLAKKYHAVIIYANQVGGNDELIFDGTSMIFIPGGSLFFQAPSFRESFFMFNTEKVGAPGKGMKFKVSAPGQQHSKISAPENEGDGVEEVTQTFEALKLGLADYVNKTGFQRVVIGLSGGIDSAVTAALAAAALEPEQVLGVMMPSRYSSVESTQHTAELAFNLGIQTRTIPIEEPFQAYLRLLNRDLSPLMDSAEENIQARIRGNILMFISNREGRMVLNTGNKSELSVGYCTLYGDMSGGLAVLADVPKQMVYRLAAFINRDAKIIPDAIIRKEPSAELRPDQKDRDSLPPYDMLDQIIYHYVEENRSAGEITAMGFAEKTVTDMIKKIDSSEYKRFQAPPGLRVTTRAFGSGRRMPIARK